MTSRLISTGKRKPPAKMIRMNKELVVFLASIVVISGLAIG